MKISRPTFVIPIPISGYAVSSDTQRYCGRKRIQCNSETEYGYLYHCISMNLRDFRIHMPTVELALALATTGCSGSDSPPSAASGGSEGVGGGGHGDTGGSSFVGNSTGGAAATGGKQATGGVVSTGGNIGVGGQPPQTGGAPALGGNPSTGGARPTGGTPSTGGAATGGASNNGGARTGGASSTGGALPVTTGGATTGGRATSGGAIATGGMLPTGGVTATGGARPTGGSSATGSGGSTTIGTGPVSLACPGAAPSGTTVDWCSCDQWGQWVNGSATFYNDIWGSGAGQQCIWANKSNQFGVAAAHPSGGSVKSYPNISYSPGTAISAINTYTSSFAVTVPSNGVYETTYDIWPKNGNTRVEIMLWVNMAGGNQPIARSYGAGGAVADFTNVSVGGHSWNVYTGSNGSNHVVSFLRTSNTNSGAIDVKAVLNWIITNEKSFTASWTLDQVQFGFEIISDSGTQSFITSSFSVSSS